MTFNINLGGSRKDNPDPIQTRITEIRVKAVEGGFEGLEDHEFQLLMFGWAVERIECAVTQRPIMWRVAWPLGGLLAYVLAFVAGRLFVI